MTHAVLHCAGVTVAYDGEPVLHAVDLSVAADEVIALLGPSGSGKTTLLYAVAGFVGVTGGSIRLRGREVATPGVSVPPEQRDVGVVFQHAALWPHYSALETVAYPLRRKGARAAEARREALTLLETVGIAELANRRPSQLSGGQQQRVGLARAMARDPSLYLFDEPTAHLDTALRASLHAELAARRRAAGAAALYATHDAAEALAIADRIVLLRDGRIIQSGPPGQVYAEPVDLWAARLTGPAATVPARITGRDGGEACLVIGDQPVEVPATGDWAHGDVLVLLRPEWVRLEGPLHGTVEDVWYRGPHTDYSVRTEVGTITARVTGPPGAASGDAVRWSATSAHLLPATVSR